MAPWTGSDLSSSWVYPFWLEALTSEGSCSKVSIRKHVRLNCSVSPTGHPEADVHCSEPTRLRQQRPVHGTHHLHHHAGEQRTFVSHHQLPGPRLGQQQRQCQRNCPQDRRRLHGGHAASRRLHFHARYVGGENHRVSCPHHPQLSFYTPNDLFWAHPLEVTLCWPSCFVNAIVLSSLLAD